MALFMVNGLTPADVSAGRAGFRRSVRELFRGDGQRQLAASTKADSEERNAFTDRPAGTSRRLMGNGRRFRKKFSGAKFTDVLSSLLYPKVLRYWAFRQKFGNVSKVPTSVFFYGLKPGEETIIEIAQGWKSVIRAAESVGTLNGKGSAPSSSPSTRPATCKCRDNSVAVNQQRQNQQNQPARQLGAFRYAQQSAKPARPYQKYPAVRHRKPKAEVKPPSLPPQEPDGGGRDAAKRTAACKPMT
jgi:pyruvate carboxylase